MIEILKLIVLPLPFFFFLWKTSLDGKVEVLDENSEMLGFTFRAHPLNKSAEGAAACKVFVRM